MSIEFLSNLYLYEIPFVTVYEAYKSDYPMKNPGRYHCGMLYTIEGSEIYHFENNTINTIPDSVLIIPENEKYVIGFEGEKSLVITVDFEIPKNVTFDPFIVKLEKNNSVKSLFFDMEKEWRRQAPESSVLNKAMFYRIVSLLIRRMNTYRTSITSEKIYLATEYLHSACLDKDFRIDQLVKMCSVSRRYFEKLFFDVHGISPKEYIINYKLNLAKKLLLNERSSITDIAERLGYSDVYHFSKIFKAKTGFTPTDYKKRHSEE